jgi:predicted transcriptional regulator
MEYRDAGELVEKPKGTGGFGNKGITAFIRTQLEAIPVGKGVSFSELRKELRAKFPTVKNTTQANARIGIVADKYKEEFTRATEVVGGMNYTYIVRVKEHTKSSGDKAREEIEESMGQAVDEAIQDAEDDGQLTDEQKKLAEAWKSE